jgi:hypothetical protein
MAGTGTGGGRWRNEPCRRRLAASGGGAYCLAQGVTRPSSAGGGFDERGGAERATACRDRYIAEAFRAFLVVGSGAPSPRRVRARILFTGSTMKKYTAAAIRMNETTELMNPPIGKRLPLTVNSIAEKSGFPTDRCDQGHDQILYQRGDDGTKRHAHHDRDGEIENDAAEYKLPEALHLPVGVG